jgi:hypothetical protein
VLRRYWPHCLASVAVLPGIFVGVLLESGVASALLFGAYVIWQSYHFSRQNYGLIALAAGSQKHGPLPRLLVPMLNISAVGGAIGSLGASAIYPIGTVPGPLLGPTIADAMCWIGIACFVFATAILLWMLACDPRLRRSPRTLLFTILGWAFFIIPASATAMSAAAIWSCGIAHAAQYLLITGVCAKRSSYGWLGLVAMIAIAAGGCVGLLAMRGTAIIYQINLAIVGVHFLADARLWQMRDPVAASSMRPRLAFLFGTAPERA